MIDIVVLVILILFAVLGWKRGLMRTLTELLAVILALVFSVQISRAAAPVVIDKAVRPATHAAIEQRVEELMEESVPERSPLEELERVVEAIPNEFIREHAHGLLEEMGEAAQSALAPTQERLGQAGKDLADTVLDGVVRDLLQSILCAACFVILTILFRFAARILCLAEKLPLVHELSGLGGALIGLGKGLILAALALWVLKQTGVIPLELAGKSLAMRFLACGAEGLAV